MYGNNHLKNQAYCPRVLFLDHTAKLGGGEIALFHLLTQIESRRFLARVILFSNGTLAERLAGAGVPVTVMPLPAAVGETRKDSLGGRSLLNIKSLLSSTRFVWQLSRLLRQEQADIIHTNSLKSDILGGLAARIAGIPVIWHVRDRINDDYLPPRVVKLFRFLCHIVPTRVIANSKSTLATITRGREAGFCDVVYDGTVITDEIRKIPLAQSLPRSPKIIGLVGRLTPWKGQHIFLNAAAQVLKKFTDVRFEIIGSAMFGETDYEADLHRLSKTLGLENTLEFCGFCDDVQDRIGRLDLLVHASITGEPFGQVIIEGMAAGKPIVATNGGGVPEIVVDGVTGILVPMNDADAMAAAICTILADSDRAAKMGIAGRQRVMQRFLVQHTADGVMRVFDEVLSTRRLKRRSKPTSPLRATDPTASSHA